MTRLTALNPGEATGKTKELFNGINNKLGMVPNMMKTMGNSATFLEAYLNLNATLGAGALGAKTGELIALAVAEVNGCDYCLSAHTYIGQNLVKIDAATLSSARTGNAADAKTAAILKFVKAVLATKGSVSDDDLAAVQSAGLSEGEIGEIIGHVALNVMTNYFNNTARTEIDFPKVTAV